jgi:hypothetical protein
MDVLHSTNIKGRMSCMVIWALSFPGNWIKKHYGLPLVSYKLGENWPAKDIEWTQIL